MDERFKPKNTNHESTGRIVCIILKEQHLTKFDMKPRICNPNYVN